MSVTFTSTLVTQLTAFVYYDGNYDPTNQSSGQPFNNSPTANLAGQYQAITTDTPATGLDVPFKDSYVSIQGTDTDGNMYYWVSFLINPPTTTVKVTNISSITESGTLIDLDKVQYQLLVACTPGIPCPDGLACYNDPISKKNYCVGIGTSNKTYLMLGIYILIFIILVIIVAFVSVKIFHVIRVR
jgi:hypothetical protein